jgi:hypothetical protein
MITRADCARSDELSFRHVAVARDDRNLAGEHHAVALLIASTSSGGSRRVVELTS